MKQELTPEQVIEMGKMWGDVYLSTLDLEERLRGLGSEELLKALLKRLPAGQIEDCLRRLGPEELLKALLKRLPAGQIEDCLRKLEKEEQGTESDV